MPNRDEYGLQRANPNDHNQSSNVLAHLLGTGKGRHLKLGGITKEERVQQQLKAAERRVKKQLDNQEKLKQELELVKAKDKIAMAKIQEREKLRGEVVAEYQAAANNFVSEETAKMRLEMQQQMEQELQQRLAQAQLQRVPVQGF